MLLFGLSVFVLIAACTVIIWPAISRNTPLNQVDVDQENLTIAQQRMSELSQNTEIEEEDRTELEAALLDDLRGPNYNLRHPAPGGIGSRLLILAILPVAAISLYLLLGNMEWQNQSSTTTDASAHPGSDINSSLAGLEKSLGENPDNADGWALAGRTYMTLGQYAKAEKAYAHVDKLAGGDPDILTAWADASLMTNGGQFTDEIYLRVRRALALNPNQKNALWIAGIGAQAQGDHKSALSYLQKLRPMLEDHSQAARRVDSLIAQSGSGQMAQPELVANSQSEPNSIVINVSVDITDEIRKLSLGTDTVFVFARAPNGPPFPLAVSRITVADLPARVVLDDSLAMVEGRNLSSVEQVVVIARVSKGGNPIAQPGDLTSSAMTATTKDSPDLSLIIDSVVE